MSHLNATDASIDETDLRAFATEVRQNQEKETYFLNFGFAGGSSINSIRFKWPSVSAISQPSEVVQCREGGHKRCSHSLSLAKDANVTMVLLNLGTGSAISHPIHLHGHTYEVIKMGMPTVDSSGNIIANDDIECENGVDNSESNCSNASWRDSDWNIRLPRLNDVNPVRKDTVVVPYGGYTVIRFTAANPGVWFMHCHIDQHMIEGMAIMINESFDASFGKEDFYTVPTNFPKCHNYHNDQGQSNNLPIQQARKYNPPCNSVGGDTVNRLLFAAL